jgi:dTDP-4-amino-4,6-dideoxygalactose transaminase
MNWHIPLSNLDFGAEESLAVQKVLESGWLTMGSVTIDFENAFKQYNGCKHAFAVANCTAALHLACLAVGLGPGDEAIVPSLTFVATANAIRYTGATPVFADIVGEQDLNISPASIEACITERTRAIIVVHYAGYPCDMDAILAIAKKHNLKVIEDAAHAVGSELDGKKLGGWADVGCYSFFSNKNMTTGEGGMVITNDDHAAEKIRLMRSHGMTTLTWDRHQGHAWGYDVVELGYNYRIDEVRSAMGLVQLAKLDQKNQRRRELTSLYRSALNDMIPEVIVPFDLYRGVSAAHIMPIILPRGVDRIHMMEFLKDRGIQSSNHYPPIHQFTAYRQVEGHEHWNLPMTDDLAVRELTLPMYPAMQDEDVMEIVEIVRDGVLLQEKAFAGA